MDDNFDLPVLHHDPEALTAPDRSSLGWADLLAEVTKTVKFFGSIVSDEMKPITLRLSVADRQLKACELYAKILGKCDLETRISQLESSLARVERDLKQEGT